MPTQSMKFRTARQIMGVRAQLKAAINASEDRVYAVLDLKTARNLLEICDQAEHTERNHESPR